MKQPTLYRKRLIPEECILLKDDVILQCNEDLILTKWNTIKSRRDLSHGYSAYYLKEGFKVSMFFRADNTLLYWYCDIVDYEYDEATNSLTSTDLLVDVIIRPDGFVKVVDLDELATAMREGIVDNATLARALDLTDRLLRIIYSEHFSKYQEPLRAISKYYEIE